MKKGLTVQMALAIVTASFVLFTAAVASQPVSAKYTSVDWKKAEANYISALGSGNLGIRQSAATYIAQYQLRGAVDPLIDMLKTDKVEQARMAAALALVTLEDAKARTAVEEAALYDGSDRVAKFCESLLNASPQKFSALE